MVQVPARGIAHCIKEMTRRAQVPNKSTKPNGRELAAHNAKIRKQRSEIDRLNRSLKNAEVRYARLKLAHDYLLKTATDEAKADPPVT